MSYPKRMTSIHRDQIKPYTLRLEQLRPGESTTFTSRDPASITLLRSRLYVWFCTQGYDKKAFTIVRESLETIRVNRTDTKICLDQLKSIEFQEITIGEIQRSETKIEAKTKTSIPKEFVDEKLKDITFEDDVITLANKARAEKRLSPAQVLEVITIWKEKRRFK